MKKTFNIIKRIFKENKEYFIKCTIMSCIAALIMGFVIGLTVPASAADDPAESDQVIIPAGTYTWNDTLDLTYSTDNSDPFDDGSNIINIPFTTERLSVEFDGEIIELYQWEAFDIEQVTAHNSGNLFYSTDSGGTIPVYNGYLESGLTEILYWNAGNYLTLGAVPMGYGKTFSVTEDTSVPSKFGLWFFNNTSGGGSVDPDPDPDPDPSYLITSGWYRFFDDPIIDTDLDFDLPFLTYMDLGFGYISYSCNGIITNMGTTSIMRYNIGTTTTGTEIDVPVYTIEVPANPDRWRYPSAKEIYVTRDVTLPPIAYEWFTSNAGRMFNPPPAPDVPDDPDPSPGDGFLATIVKGVTSIFNMQFLVIDGYVITFGGIFSACVGLSLFIWLLKVFAGG